MQDIVVTAVVSCAMLLGLATMLRSYEPSERPLLQLGMLAHLASGAALTILMRDFLGGGDMLLYHRIGSELVKLLWRQPGETLSILWGLVLQTGQPLPVPDMGLGWGTSGSMLALTTVSLFVTGSSLPGACVLIAGFSFFAKLRIYDVCRAELSRENWKGALASCLLIPSIVFWSSGLIKEAFATIGLGLVFKEIHGFFRGHISAAGFVRGATGALLIATIKGYILVALGAAAVATVLLSRERRARSRSRFRSVLVAVLGAALVMGAGVLSSRYDPENLLDETVRLQDVGDLAVGGSNYTITEERSVRGSITALPAALGTALFRPWIFEAENAQMAANGLETFVFAVLFAIGFLRGSPRLAYEYIRKQPILVFCAVFSATMAAGVGLASTNLGTLSRYRMPMMPFVWVLITSLVAGRRTRRSSERGAPNAATLGASAHEQV